MDKQKKLNDFFGIAKDKKSDKDDFSNQRGNEIVTERRETSNILYPEAPYKKTNFSNQNFRATEKSNNTSGPTLDDCRTYALPCHIPRIWIIVEPKLIAITNNKVTD